MPDLSVARKTAGDLRWHVVGYGLGLGVLAAAVVTIYPSYAATAEQIELPAVYEASSVKASQTSRGRAPSSRSSSSPGCHSILATFAVINGTGLLAGEEGAGTLEILLAQPIRRRGVFLQKLLALAAATAAIHLLSALGFLLSAPFVDLRDEIGPLELFAAMFSVAPFALCCVALSVLAAAITPARGLAAGLMTITVIMSYLFNALANLVAGLDWVRYLSPFFYSDAQRVLTSGVTWWHQALLLAAAGVAAVLALLAFERREIGTDRSPLAALVARVR